MSTYKEIVNSLEKIHTGFFGDNGKELGLDNFASFLECVKPLPATAQILSDFAANNEQILPTTLRDKYAPDFSLNQGILTSNKELNKNVMVVSLNMAARPQGNDHSGYDNFHDMINITNTSRMYLQLNDDRFKGCYITDIVKSVVDSNSLNVKRDFFAKSFPNLSFANNASDTDRANKYYEWSQKDFENPNNKDDKPRFASEADALKAVQHNKAIFEKSVQIFAQEFQTIQPKRILVFGDDAYNLLQQMTNVEIFKNDPKLIDAIKQSVKLPHYATQSNFEEWCKNATTDTINAIG